MSKEPTLLLQASVEELRYLYVEQRLQQKELAIRYQCSPNQIKSHLCKLGLSKSFLKELYQVPKKELVRLYLVKQLSSRELGRKYRCSHISVNKLLRAYGVKIRSTSEARYAEVEGYATLTKSSIKEEEDD